VGDPSQVGISGSVQTPPRACRRVAHATPPECAQAGWGRLELTGLDTGLVAAGTATNPALADLILANPENYYVNVHPTVCPRGTVRGQLG
jgi:hypothetical protein